MNDAERMEELMRVARAAFEPTQSDRERVKGRLVLRAAVFGAAGSLASKAAASAAATNAAGVVAPALVTLSKVFLGSMLITLGAASGIYAVTHQNPSASNTSEVRAVTRAVRPEVRAAAGAAARERNQETPRPGATASTSTQSPPSSTPRTGNFAKLVNQAKSFPSAERAEPVGVADPALMAELALLQQARRASALGDPERALQMLERLELEQPRGALMEERRALRVIAACQSGRAVTPEVEGFLRRHPASVYAARVQSACRSLSLTELQESGH